jgi:hypothetical protein
MASSRSFTVNSHDFLFKFGDWTGSGICLDPETSDLNDPEYLLSLKVALALYVELSRFYEWLDSQYYSAHGEPFNFTPELDFPEYARGYVDSLRELIESEINGDRQAKIERAIKDKTITEKREAEKRKGFVYIIHNTNLNVYKIGKSRNPKSRIKNIADQLFDPIETIHVFSVVDMSKSEIFLHTHFQAKRVRGEWFTLDQADLEAAKAFMEAQS